MEQRTEIPSTRDPASYQIQHLRDDWREYLPNASQNALYEPNNWFPRSDLRILFPQQKILGNNITTANISQPAIDGISAYISDLFGGEIEWFGQFGCTGAALAGGSSLSAMAGNYAPASMQALVKTPSLDTTFSNLAASISANMRGTSDDQLMAPGQLGLYETFIEMHWPWIALPCICICLGTIFLILVIRQTKKLSLPVWKSGIFAVLTHGLEDAAMRRVENETLNSQIERSMNGMVVTLGEKLKLEFADDISISSKTDSQSREADLSPSIDVRTRYSSLFASQEVQALTTARLLHRNDA